MNFVDFDSFAVFDHSGGFGNFVGFQSVGGFAGFEESIQDLVSDPLRYRSFV